MNGPRPKPLFTGSFAKMIRIMALGSGTEGSETEEMRLRAESCQEEVEGSEGQNREQLSRAPMRCSRVCYILEQHRCCWRPPGIKAIVSRGGRSRVAVNNASDKNPGIQCRLNGVIVIRSHIVVPPLCQMASRPLGPETTLGLTGNQDKGMEVRDFAEQARLHYTSCNSQGLRGSAAVAVDRGRCDEPSKREKTHVSSVKCRLV
jgi:hypothetical protein